MNICILHFSLGQLVGISETTKNLLTACKRINVDFFIILLLWLFYLSDFMQSLLQHTHTPSHLHNVMHVWCCKPICDSLEKYIFSSSLCSLHEGRGRNGVQIHLLLCILSIMWTDQLNTSCNSTLIPRLSHHSVWSPAVCSVFVQL